MNNYANIFSASLIAQITALSKRVKIIAPCVDRHGERHIANHQPFDGFGSQVVIGDNRYAFHTRGHIGRAAADGCKVDRAGLPERVDHGGAALALADWPGAPGSARTLWVRGHEFHYAQEQPDPLPAQCSPLWQMHDSQGRFLRADGCRNGSVAGSWLHCYPEGSRRFWRAWLGLCSTYLKANGS